MDTDDRDALTSDAKEARTLALAAAGALAGGVASELRSPLRELRESLAVIVEILDHHLNTSEGPAAYPWEKTKALRERVASAYLIGRKVARLNAELADAINSYDQRAHFTPVHPTDVNDLVEIATNLSRHRIGVDTELFIDFGKVPKAAVAPGSVVLLLARLLAIAADSARDVQGAAVSVSTRLDPERDQIVLHVADSGSGLPDEADTACVLGNEVAMSVGGSFHGTSKTGTGSVFVLRIPVAT